MELADLLVSDLVGCKYRRPQRLRFPDVQRNDQELARIDRAVAGRQVVYEKLPTKRGFGDSKSKAFLRIDLPEAELDDDSVYLNTLEALATGADLITSAQLHGRDAGYPWRIRVEVLARQPDGSYLPVIVSNHRVARRDESGQFNVPVIATNRLSLSQPVDAPFRPRHHVSDGYRLAFAARALQDLGLDSGLGGVIGQDRDRVFVTDTATLQPALNDALLTPFATAPRRLKECSSCRFWPKCEPELLQADEISLVLPGDRARRFRKAGVETVEKLIELGAGDASIIAKAWRENIPVVKRGEVTVPYADVEVDVDMEAYLDQGAYLWGLFDGDTYHGFVTWEAVGGEAEARNFAAFWEALMKIRADAHARGKSFAAHCYSAHGENHWLKASARRFADYPGVPTLAEVTEFISSDEWVDMFVPVRKQLLGSEGLGLKIVARAAGYRWEEDFDGEQSVAARRLAVSAETDEEKLRVREQLLQYNEDDTRATAAVRSWLRQGAPGIPSVGEIASIAAD